MATIKDVARSAGVSVSTVSHVINGTRFVSPDVHARVSQVVQALGYVPSAVARSLKNNVTHTVGMLIPNCGNPYFAEMIRAVEDRCFERGYNLLLCNTDDEPARQQAYLQVMAQRRVDGIIVVSTSSNAAFDEQLAAIRLPMVLVDREISGSTYAVIETANAKGGQLAAKHLLDQGHRRIACISGPLGLSPSDQRVQGWQAAMAEANLSVQGLLGVGDFTSQGGYACMSQMLQNDKSLSAVFVCNDLMAIGAMRAAVEAGYSLPNDLSFVGFDDIELARYTSPPLTTIAQPKREIGQGAVDCLIDQIENPNKKAMQAQLLPSLRLRSSTVVREVASSELSGASYQVVL